MNDSARNKSGSYGKWSSDDSGLSCFDLFPDAGPDYDASLTHLMSTGRAIAFVDRWGALALSTTLGGNGYVELLANRWRCRSLVKPVVHWNGELYSLGPGEAKANKRARYGTGYAEFSGEYALGNQHRLQVATNFTAPWQRTAGIVIEITIRNLGSQVVTANWSVRSDMAPWSNEESEADNQAALRLEAGLAGVRGVSPGAGDAALIGADDWTAQRRFHSVWLEREYSLEPGSSWTIRMWVGYLDGSDPSEIRRLLETFDARTERAAWASRLRPVVPPDACEQAQAEAKWTMGQLLSFASYDGALQESYIALGGYAWQGFPVRECAETLMVISPWFPDLALSNMRWLAKLQWSNGDLPKGHGFTPPSLAAASAPHESDNEIWFVIGILEAIAAGLPETVLDQSIPWADDGAATLWDHLIAAWSWIENGIGVGRHGVPRIWRGDWNDYLSSMGRRGEGESVMNAGLACRAGALLLDRAVSRLECNELIESLQTGLTKLRDAAAAAWTGSHFARGWDDDGNEVGGKDGRVFINAQSWCALGQVGAIEQRRTALREALETCSSPIGLTLCSRPFSNPPPPAISWCPIPEGEGENGGIWPQTVHWMIWALAECGLIEEAEELWHRVSLRRHSDLHPDVPYGVFNGPDCYSSHHAAVREGRTQIALIDRGKSVPMNPSVAWQAFSLNRIYRARRGSSLV